MSYHRMGHTGRQMQQSRVWVKLDKKHYQHLSGVQIRYNHNRWLWEVIDGPEDGRAWPLLHVARHYVERGAFLALPTVGGVQ